MKLKDKKLLNAAILDLMEQNIIWDMEITYLLKSH